MLRKTSTAGQQPDSAPIAKVTPDKLDPYSAEPRQGYSHG